MAAQKICSADPAYACAPLVEVLVRHTVIQTRQRLVEEWQAKRPKRDDFADWSAWSTAWGFWLIDMSHALERFDRRERWVRERIFA
jgi:hypothetical protein